jgi:hypothetical protein
MLCLGGRVSALGEGLQSKILLNVAAQANCLTVDASRAKREKNMPKSPA